MSTLIGKLNIQNNSSHNGPGNHYHVKILMELILKWYRKVLWQNYTGGPNLSKVRLMADIVVDPQITDPCELVKLGTKAYILRDFNTAVTAYSRAIELVVSKHGDKHDSLGDIYLCYGRTLLDISRDEAQALGDAVPRDFSSDSEAEEDNNENIEKEKNGAAVNNDDGDKAEVEGEVDEKNGQPEKVDETNADPSASKAEGEPTEEKSEGEPTDLQLAWEVLELAKIIFEQQGAAGRKGLSETLVLLGDVSLESENFESAVADIKAGLEIQKEIFDPESRTLAETYYKVGIALATNNQIDEAIENYNASLEVLNRRLAKLKEDEVNQEDEIKDIESLIPDIQDKIADMKSYKEEATKLVAAVASKPITATKFDTGSSVSSDKKLAI
ncbi:hypothetical protein FQR65_LT08634 [Abscondita terminalis]|nr:hypothetical protein FQR65_LT08634 [Abscondita terminalis]